MNKINFKIKLYPITENGHEIFRGDFIDVLKIDFVKGIASTISGNTNPLVTYSDGLMGIGRYDNWELYSNRNDRRDKQTELWLAVGRGRYQQVDLSEQIEKKRQEEIRKYGQFK